MLVSFPHLFAEINPKYSEYKDEKVELAVSPSTLSLEIIFPHYLEAEELGKIFYSLYNKLFYLFNNFNKREKLLLSQSKISYYSPLYNCYYIFV